MPITSQRGRWWTALAAAGAVLALAACSSGASDPDAGGDGGSGEQAAYNIGWLGGLESDPYFITMQCGAQPQRAASWRCMRSMAPVMA